MPKKKTAKKPERVHAVQQAPDANARTGKPAWNREGPTTDVGKTLWEQAVELSKETYALQQDALKAGERELSEILGEQVKTFRHVNFVAGAARHTR